MYLLFFIYFSSDLNDFWTISWLAGEGPYLWDRGTGYRIIYCLNKLNPWLCLLEDEITWLPEFVSFTLFHSLFVILHMPFCKAKSGSEQLSDVSPSLLLVMSCWITEIAVTRKVGVEGCREPARGDQASEGTFSCIPKPLSYRGGRQISHSVTWASLKSSSPDVCSVLFPCRFAFKLYDIIFL